MAKTTRAHIAIAIIQYPNALRSAVYGLEEMFQLANRLCEEQQVNVRFNTRIINTEHLADLTQHVIILPCLLYTSDAADE